MYNIHILQNQKNFYKKFSEIIYQIIIYHSIFFYRKFHEFNNKKSKILHLIEVRLLTIK